MSLWISGRDGASTSEYFVLELTLIGKIMLTEKDYCDKDLSATLMKMGFRGFGHFYYEKDSSKLKATHQFLTIRTAKGLGHTLAISLYEAQKFLREEKGIIVRVIPIYEERKLIKGISYTHEVIYWTDGYVTDECIEEYPSYEEALSEGIKEAVKLLQEKK